MQESASSSPQNEELRTAPCASPEETGSARVRADRKDPKAHVNLPPPPPQSLQGLYLRSQEAQMISTVKLLPRVVEVTEPTAMMRSQTSPAQAKNFSNRASKMGRNAQVKLSFEGEGTSVIKPNGNTSS